MLTPSEANNRKKLCWEEDDDDILMKSPQYSDDAWTTLQFSPQSPDEDDDSHELATDTDFGMEIDGGGDNDDDDDAGARSEPGHARSSSQVKPHEDVSFTALNTLRRKLVFGSADGWSIWTPAKSQFAHEVHTIGSRNIH